MDRNIKYSYHQHSKCTKYVKLIFHGEVKNQWHNFLRLHTQKSKKAKGEREFGMLHMSVALVFMSFIYLCLLQM
jgi:hypothetical protein